MSMRDSFEVSVSRQIYLQALLPGMLKNRDLHQYRVMLSTSNLVRSEARSKSECTCDSFSPLRMQSVRLDHATVPTKLDCLRPH
jgi:hypothetical protein